MSKREIGIETGNGSARAGLFTPDAGTAAAAGLPGVILYMDIFGPRPSLDGMAQRLADHGYLVLVPDLFYRFGAYEFDPRTAFSETGTRERMMSMMKETPYEVTERDTGAFIGALTENGAGRIGTTGYCMGGGHALTAAAGYPDRVAAAASFHGGRLATDAENSPHRRAGEMKAALYIGTAGVDNSCPPEQSALLARSLREAELSYIVENYVGMRHGWVIPDHGAFNEKGAERHWKRLITFFEENLK